MSETGMKLSAYLDGELPPDESAALAARLRTDAGLRAELEALSAANDAAKKDFAAMLSAPMPLSLARAIDRIPEPVNLSAAPAVARGLPVWATLAASLALFAVGAGGGYVAGQRNPTETARDWVAEIADYHAVYATQTRHLAEVPASDVAHLVKWLTDQTGVPFEIPDLSGQGLDFQGGRLLVAAGKPVGQLMYLDAAGQVVALCFIASDKPATDAIETRNLGGFDALIWGKPGARFILIGPKDYPGFTSIADSARSV
jgi:anti-sigma factor RsiW